MSVKREVSEENRKFNSNWKERYSFSNNDGKPQCLARLQVISSGDSRLKKMGGTLRGLGKK